MMSEAEIRAWRNVERNRIQDLVNMQHIENTRLIVNILSRVLQDD